jgi:sodium/bile acid cotransporter 7
LNRDFIRRYWFLAALILIIPIGLAWPEGGEFLAHSRWIIQLFVGIMLFLTSFMMDAKKLAGQATNWRAWLIVISHTYIIAPLAAFGLAQLFAPANEPHFVTAMMIMAAQAGSLASAIALTHMAGGSRELALICTLLSNGLTFVLTPLILQISIGAQVQFPLSDMILRMVVVVLLPICLGQLLRRLFFEKTTAIQPALKIAPQLIILMFVYTGFSAAENELRDAPALALRFLGACIPLHLFLLTLGGFTSGLLRLPWPERTAVIFCGSQKTLPNGMFIWRTFFMPHDGAPAQIAHVPYGAVPLVLYHLFQLIVDTLLVPFFEKRNGRDKEHRTAPAMSCHQDE